MAGPLHSSSAPPIATYDRRVNSQREAIFKPYGIQSLNELVDLGRNVEETGSFWTTRETSFSGADIKIYLLVYDRFRKQRMIDDIDAQLKASDEEIANDYLRALAGADAVLTGDRSLLDTDYLNAPGTDSKARRDDLQAARGAMLMERSKLTADSAVVLELAEAQTLSVSSHRDKFPVRALGSVGPRGWSRGMRTIAGTMIFTVFNRHPLGRILYSDFYSFEGFNDTKNEGYELPDQLPPLDLMLLGANEYGYMCRMVLYGVEFVSEGMTFSIEDLITESQLQYVARDWDPLRDVENEFDLFSPNKGKAWSVSGTDLVSSAEYDRYRRRSNPFI